MMQKTGNHILIAEDEANLATSLHFILAASKYRVSMAQNGKDAYTFIKSGLVNGNPVDMLITDILMPEMDGEQLLTQLQKEGVEIPTLIMTGYGEKAMLVRLMRLGCRDFVDKPFEPETMLERVKSILHTSWKQSVEAAKKERLASLGEQTSQIVHDINNILAITLGNAETALRKIEDTHPLKKAIEKMVASSCRAAEICKGLLLKSNGIGGSFLVATEVNSLVERMATVLMDVAPQGVRVMVETPAKPLWLRADSERLQQALLNLGFNAFAAMPKGGILTMKVHFEEALRKPEAGTLQECVVFSLEDTGIGMSAQAIEQIFNNGFSISEKGHGMGLACVRKIVEEEHRGWIDIRSSKDKGTQFRLCIPVNN